MGKLLTRIAPVAVAVAALGVTASPAFAATHPTKRPTHHATAHAKTFSLRGRVVSLDAKTHRFDLAVGKKDVALEFTAKTVFVVGHKKETETALKSGKTVTARGDITGNLRVATSVTVG